MKMLFAKHADKRQISEDPPHRLWSSGVKEQPLKVPCVQVRRTGKGHHAVARSPGPVPCAHVGAVSDCG